MFSVNRPSTGRSSLVVLTCAPVMAALLVLATALTAPAAHAQGYAYGYEDGSPWWKPAYKKPKPQRAKASRRPDATTAVKPAADKPAVGPLVLVVSLKHQRVTVYDQSGVVAVSPISSGTVSNPTPMGVFSVLEKQKVHFSNLYDSAPMPNMQRITWSGVALHAGVLPGYPASHGCIRLPHGFSQRLFNMTKTGARVIVTRDDAPVQLFSHAKLFQATGFGFEPSAAEIAGSKLADASGRMVASPVQRDAAVISPYRQKWLTEMDRRSEALAAAETTKNTAAANIVAATNKAEAAAAALKSAQADAERIAQAIKKSEASRLATEKELDAFAKALLAERRMTDEQTQSSALREDALDAKLDTISGATTDLTAQAETAAVTVQSARELVASTGTDLKSALSALAPVTANLKTAEEAVEEAKRREAKRQLPIAVFISRQTKKLYARQGYAPILEMPVEIVEPDKPLGTHVYTAMSVEPSSKVVNWTVWSMPTGAVAEAKPKDKSRSKKDAIKEQPALAPQSLAAQTPAAALDRMVIPEEARELISDAMKPGSSLLISDHGLNNETGRFTDFIVGLR